MIDRLDEALRFQSEALRLRGERQSVLASNIANADTPNYKAVDFDFAAALKEATSGGPRTGASPGPTMLFRQPAQASIDGNSVEMDAERAQFADNTIRYEAALRFLNQQIKTMLTALQSS